PKDPWGNEYVYKCPGEKYPDSYDLLSLGKDGQAGTEDDVEK
ncbi:MAG: type II secretion system protein GspG, partial [Planctomycetes bacterium]|nr:type II secretion system protein GspG [Planctomycetota bacterium]